LFWRFPRGTSLSFPISSSNIFLKASTILLHCCRSLKTRARRAQQQVLDKQACRSDPQLPLRANWNGDQCVNSFLYGISSAHTSHSTHQERALLQWLYSLNWIYWMHIQPGRRCWAARQQTASALVTRVNMTVSPAGQSPRKVECRFHCGTGTCL
jgi:hypothetical protein